MGLKDIFTTQKPIVTEQKFQNDDSDDSIAVISGASYTARGTRDAGYCGGSSQALLPKLHAVYMQLTRYIQQDEMKQSERKSSIRQEISSLEAKNANIENERKTEQDKLAHEESKIDKTIKEIDNIKENPRIISGDSFAKASFWIGFVILVFLTIYLFVFYSSAAYSAFFKNFTPDDTKITQAIFDAQAVGKAWADGFTELIFILAIPAVFLGLGFLIHKFSEEKGFGKYFKILSLIIVTFIFDFIIAYAIVKEIYNIKIGGLFQEMPPMSIERAFQEVNFWIIIFAGFVVYIIWGLVFSFTMSEYEKMDKVRYAIKNKEQKLIEYKTDCKNIKGKISMLQTEKNNTQGEIDKLRIQLESYVLYFNDVREGINNYFAGWVGFLKSTSSSISHINECEQIKEKFLTELKNSEFIKPNKFLSN
jgi:peptidoglycan hydrolase CwlO-like protein